VYSKKRNRFILGNISQNGYRQITIDGSNVLLHRLLALLFLPNPKNKCQINHIDGNKLNNCLSNLEWVTQSENAYHAHKTGLIKPCCSELRKDSKLKVWQVKSIRWLYRYYPMENSQPRLARSFSVSQSVIHSIVNNKTWKSCLYSG
jgi:hypothetical protein